MNCGFKGMKCEMAEKTPLLCCYAFKRRFVQSPYLALEYHTEVLFQAIQAIYKQLLNTAKVGALSAVVPGWGWSFGALHLLPSKDVYLTFPAPPPGTVQA